MYRFESPPGARIFADAVVSLGIQGPLHQSIMMMWWREQRGVYTVFKSLFDRVQASINCPLKAADYLTLVIRITLSLLTSTWAIKTHVEGQTKALTSLCAHW